MAFPDSGPDKPMSFVPGTDFRHATPPNREIYSGRPARTYKSAGISRSAEDRNDAHAQQKMELVQTLITFLRGELSTKDFDHRILVASPEIPSDFRQHQDPALKHHWPANWRRT